MENLENTQKDMQIEQSLLGLVICYMICEGLEWRVIFLAPF